jgi:hypothetical protein
MNEVSLRARDAAPVTWAELKVELLAVAQALATATVASPETLREELACVARDHAGSVFGQLLTHQIGSPRGAG